MDQSLLGKYWQAINTDEEVIQELSRGLKINDFLARYFMPIGLFCSAIISFFFGFNETLLIFGFGWILNNWFQSMGWPPVARMLTHWFAPKELGTKWALGAASHQIGGAVTLILCGYLVTHLGWQYAFWIPSIIAIIVAIALFTLLRESPQKLNLPNVETYKGEIGYNIIAEDDKANFSTREIVQKVFVISIL